ncbi:MAG: hypothetical protein VX617_07880, partial [Pseudomonadota bacterium]|nr:hypothetical protein [Pseudomonadota bacterium]
KPNTAVILLDSDFVFSDGSFSHIHQVRRSGCKTYAGMFMRLVEEEAGPSLRESLPYSLSSQKLVSIGLECMHPRQESMFFDAKEPSSYPTQINWTVDNKGFVTTCFFPHPLMVELGNKPIRYFSTMDYELHLRSAENDELYFCQSSEYLTFCKLSPKNYLSEMAVGPKHSIESMAHFAISNTNVRHSRFMRSPVRFCAVDEQSAFDEVEAVAKDYVEKIYQSIEIILSEHSSSDPQEMVFIKSFLGPIEHFVSPQINHKLKEFLS